MSFASYFQPVNNITSTDVRQWIKDKPTNQYCLLDVRQPGEYESEHLPGARLIPLGEINARLKEMDPERPVIVYCRSGNRSASAASILQGAGFKTVMNMYGGILAYNGITSTGAPEAGFFCFPETLNPQQMAAVAWLLEDGTQRFYMGLKAQDFSLHDPSLMEKLIGAEDGHKNTLRHLYEYLGGSDAEGFPRSVLPEPPVEDVMEGCVKVQEALAWAAGRPARDVFELIMALEANAYDLYLKMQRRATSKEAAHVFETLSREEHQHLDMLTAALDGLRG